MSRNTMIILVQINRHKSLPVNLLKYKLLLQINNNNPNKMLLKWKLRNNNKYELAPKKLQWEQEDLENISENTYKGNI